MSGIGIEHSVTNRFANQLQRACKKNSLKALTFHLNGQDTKANADAIFSALDKFLLIEFKSYEDGIKSENNKPRVYDLCHNLLINNEMTRSHRKGHFIMWGVEIGIILETKYTVYQDSVCRKSILNKSTSLSEPPIPTILDGEKLAKEVSESTAGIGLDDFLIYLKWLFSSKRSSNEIYDGPVSLIATSKWKYADGLIFKSFEDFEDWAKPTVIMLLNKRNNKKKKDDKKDDLKVDKNDRKKRRRI
ncbi:hypothetical protein [Lonsdalea quercina]|uniref:hypothetical protein n=1 Tax=Lonsdalea quercina TaxID=71657 RepID=UPI0039765500